MFKFEELYHSYYLFFWVGFFILFFTYLKWNKLALSKNGDSDPSSDERCDYLFPLGIATSIVLLIPFFEKVVEKILKYNQNPFDVAIVTIVLTLILGYSLHIINGFEKKSEAIEKKSVKLEVKSKILEKRGDDLLKIDKYLILKQSVYFKIKDRLSNYSSSEEKNIPIIKLFLSLLMKDDISEIIFDLKEINMRIKKNHFLNKKDKKLFKEFGKYLVVQKKYFIDIVKITDEISSLDEETTNFLICLNKL